MTQPTPQPKIRPAGPDPAPPPTPPEPPPAGYGFPVQPGPGHAGPPGGPPPAAPVWDPAPAWDPSVPRQPWPGQAYGPPGRYVPAPPPVSPAGQPLASFTDRLLAYLIDMGVFLVVSLVLTVPAFIIFFLTVGSQLFEVRPDGTVAEPDFLAFFVPLLLLEAGLMLVMLVLYYIYYVELMFRTGQTLGKRLMKIRTVPLDPAATLNRAIAAKRFLVQFVAAMFIPGVSYVDGLWQLWDKPYQQCLHDKFAQTVVVKVPG